MFCDRWTGLPQSSGRCCNVTSVNRTSSGGMRQKRAETPIMMRLKFEMLKAWGPGA